MVKGGRWRRRGGVGAGRGASAEGGFGRGGRRGLEEDDVTTNLGDYHGRIEWRVGIGCIGVDYTDGDLIAIEKFMTIVL